MVKLTSGYKSRRIVGALLHSRYSRRPPQNEVHVGANGKMPPRAHPPIEVGIVFDELAPEKPPRRLHRGDLVKTYARSE